jgi:hypothetical protein
MLPSQLAKPALQVVMAQVPLLHSADATLGRAVQLLPHLPQLFTLLENSACMHPIGKAQHGDVLLCMALMSIDISPCKVHVALIATLSG